MQRKREVSSRSLRQRLSRDAAHIQASIPGLWVDPFQPPTPVPWRFGPAPELRWIRSVTPSRDSCREEAAVRACRGAAGGAGGGGGGRGRGPSKRMEEVGKLMSLQIDGRGCWNLSSVTKPARGCGRVFRTSPSSETRRRWSCRDPDPRG